MSNWRAIADEIVRLHAFFEDWFGGVGDRSISEFADALDAEFFIVSPDAMIIDREQLISIIMERRDTGPVKIYVEQVRLRKVTDEGLHVATYEEHQERDRTASVLTSTVGLVADTNCPGGYRWLFVHETRQDN